MCGITGIWSFDQPDISMEEMDVFTDTLAHRGPDGRGTYHDEESRIRLGQRRLAILDLSAAGHQPMSYSDGRYWIVYNGEIYNYLELRKELAHLGYGFQSVSDTEVVLASFAQWGEECQFKFNGMWAFAIWDSQNQTLFLSRDRFGIKPLYYISNKRFFSFASEMKAFLALKCYEYEFDDEILRENIENITRIEGTDRCILREVKRLVGGHCLTIGPHGIPRMKRWWNTLDHLVEVPDTFDKQVETFRELFFDACRIRMRSNVPIGTSLSGGLDSSSVLATMHAIGQVEGFTTDWQKAFVACYPGTNLDEKTYAITMIESTGASPVYTEIDYHVIKNHIQDFIYQNEGINWVLGMGAWLNYRVMRENGVVISMDGHGADELLGGYAPIVEEEKNSALKNLDILYYLELRKALKNLKEGTQPVSLSIFQDIRYLMISQIISIQNKLSKISLDWCVQGSPGRSSEGIQKREIQSHLNTTLYNYFHNHKLQVILRIFDRASMAHGVEIRMPFMDWRLVTYAFSLPDCCKISDGYTKFILRAAMSSILPEPIRLRTNKIGYSSPMKEWAESGLGEVLLSMIPDLTHQYPQYYPHGDFVEDFRHCVARKDWTTITSLWPPLQAYLLIDAFNRKRESLLLECEKRVSKS